VSSHKTFCTARVADLLLGLDVAHVQEIVRDQTVHPLPRAPRDVQGLINLRGKILTVIDLRERFRKPPAESGSDGSLVVTSSEVGTVALRVDEVREVKSVSTQTFEPPPGSFQGVARALVSGVFKLDQELLLELDVAKVTQSESAAPPAAALEPMPALGLGR
jgi:purine-binding chemotaxis protein CheW